MRTANPIAYPPQLEDLEAGLVAERRARAAGHEPPAEPYGGRRLPDDALGFGLSGGGIRSATFSLGLLQALARSHQLRDIDFLSTVSGGGYVGAFLGRLFTREWIRGPEDVERVLLSLDPAGAPRGLGARVFRWLRDNGRYLAPRGSGDLLLLASIALRNWVAVQVVLVTFVLMLFVLMQILRGGLDWALRAASVAGPLQQFLVCTMPGGNTLVWWSPWLLVAMALFVVWPMPTGWAYLLVSRDRTGRAGLHPIWAAVLILLVAGSGVAWYGAREHQLRFAVCAGLAGFGALSIGWLFAARWRANRNNGSDPTGVARNLLSRWLTTGVVAAGSMLTWALVDTIGRTVYAVSADSGTSLAQWVAAVFAALAGIGAFARQIAALIGAKREGARPGPTFSTITWVAAAIVMSAWLVSIAAGSYALVWRLHPLEGKPAGIGQTPPPTILGTEHLTVAPKDGQWIVAPAAVGQSMCTVTPNATEPGWLYVWAAFGVLTLVSFVFGQTRTFANMSSMHAFYAARLTRTFLGASNQRRLAELMPVTETVPGDDLEADQYWRWPRMGSDAPKPNGAPPRYPWTRGGPLHFVNVTVNETLDAVTGVQHQDRKGTGLAVGPVGLSLGIRHHLVSLNSPVAAFPAGSGEDGKETQPHRVFSDSSATPEPLPLGRWVSISGAAFSAAAGAQTTVPIAVLAGMFNVRLGYWWDSGTPHSRNSWFARAFPVQQALLSEALARTRGTADRLWNLSDGGHFENMGGYELIRRRLPIIVIVDGEADPDYTFEGLSDLVRKARLDFNAEITFLNDEQLSGTAPIEGVSAPLPSKVRPYFGNLDLLRRGRWSDENLPPTGESKRYTIEADRSRVSRAHAALARVAYMDTGDASWLVYVKASLMGDETEDVCHYHRAHPEFPQETTTDQFFDEAQWESYRRLGVHIGHRVLQPVLFDKLREIPAPRGDEKPTNDE